jgi:hypothetical protein
MPGIVSHDGFVLYKPHSFAMSDLTHACSVFIAGLVLAGFGIAMSWHCWRSLKSGSLQISPAIVLDKNQQAGWFRFMVLFFGLCAMVLLGTGVCCISAAARLF